MLVDMCAVSVMAAYSDEKDNLMNFLSYAAEFVLFCTNFRLFQNFIYLCSNNLQCVGSGGMYWIELAQDRKVAGTCECGNEASGSIKCGEFLD